MQVLVAGAAGLLGEAVVVELRSCGYSVRAMVRSGRKVAHLRTTGATLEFGNLEDSRSLLRACYGAQALVIALPHNPFATRRSAERSGSAEMHSLIAAARQADVGQIVLISALKADEFANIARLGQSYSSEADLQSAGVFYSIVRPAPLQEWFGDRYLLKRLIERCRVGLMPGNGHSRHSFVAASDIARSVRLVLERHHSEDTIVEIGGPENLSFRDAYDRIACLSGRCILRLPIPYLAVRAGALLAQPLFPELHNLNSVVEMLSSDSTSDTPTWLVEALGKRQRLDDTLRSIYKSENCVVCDA